MAAELVHQVVHCLAWVYLATVLAGLSRRPAVGIALAGLLLVALGVLLSLGVIDDAFISLRYAHNFALGRGLIWNLGERVEGYTSLSWVLVLGALAKLQVIELPWLALLLAIAGTVVAFVLVQRLASRMLPAAAGAPRAAAMVVLGASFPCAFWAFSGMETGLALALIVGASLRFWTWSEGGPPRALVHSAGWLALASATRPEVALIWAAHLPFVLASARGGAGDSPLRRAWRFAWPFLLVQLALLIFRLGYYGHPLPNTYYAKVGAPFSHAAGALHYLGHGLLAHGWVALPALLHVLLAWRRSAAVRYLATMVLAWGAVVWITGADHFSEWRYIVYLWPYLFLLALPMLEAAAQRICAARPADSTLGPLLRTQAVAVLALLSFATSFAYDGVGPKSVVKYGRNDADRWAELGRWLHRVTPDDAVIAAPTIGAIGYYSDRTTIDMVGLTDAHIARSRIYPNTPKDHEHFDTEYVLGRKPDYIYLTTNFGSETAFLQGTHWMPAIVDLKRVFPNPDYEFVHLEGKLGGYDLYRRRAASR